MKQIFFFLFITIILALGSCKKDNKPEIVVSNNSYASQIDAWADSMTHRVVYHNKKLNLPGLIIGVKDPSKNFFYLKAFGVADVQTGRKLLPTDLFRMASNTKTFTATVILQLVDEKKLSLDDTLNKFFPEIQYSGQITIRQLLSMSSGFFDYSNSDSSDYYSENTPLRNVSPWSLIEWGTSYPLAFQPGTHCSYSNTNYIILGLLAEKLTGNKLEDEIQNRILNVLNMNNTYFPTDPEMPAGKSFSKGYDYFSEDKKMEDVTCLFHPSYPWAAGAMISNIQDLMVWAEALGNGYLLSSATQEQRLQWLPWTDLLAMDYYRYGLGIFCTKEGMIGHGGDIPGYHSFIGYYPPAKTTIVIMYNYVNPPSLLASQILRKLYPVLNK